MWSREETEPAGPSNSHLLAGCERRTRHRRVRTRERVLLVRERILLSSCSIVVGDMQHKRYGVENRTSASHRFRGFFLLLLYRRSGRYGGKVEVETQQEEWGSVPVLVLHPSIEPRRPCLPF